MNEKEIIDDMRRITMLTGEISSIHIKSLRQWCFVVFDGVESVEIEYDLTKDTTKSVGEGFVNFKMNASNIELADFKKQGEFGKRCQTLATWVRNMFWPEIRVTMYLNGQGYYYDSTIKDQPVPKKFKETEDGLNKN